MSRNFSLKNEKAIYNKYNKREVALKDARKVIHHLEKYRRVLNDLTFKIFMSFY